MVIVVINDHGDDDDDDDAHFQAKQNFRNRFKRPPPFFWRFPDQYENQDQSSLKMCLKYENMQWKIYFVQELYSFYILKDVLGVLDQTRRL